jgi:lipopolysaccharide export system protein LptA
MAAERKGAGARGLLVAFVLALLFQSSPGRGQELALGGNQNGPPVVIEARSGIEWQQTAQLYIARGNAVAKRGHTELRADTLKAYYRRAKGAQGSAAAANEGAQGLLAGSESEIYRIDADGHVVIKGPTRTVVGDHAVYDVDRGIAVVTGKALRLTTPDEAVTAHKSLEWYDKKRIAVARGDAVAMHRDRRIRADVLTAYLVKAGKGAGRSGTGKKGAKSLVAGSEGEEKIARIDATGHVVVTTANDISRGDYGVYDAEKGIVTLLHHVSITRGRDTIRGEYAVVDLNRNISRIMSLRKPARGKKPRVEALFIPRPGASPDGKGRGKP